MPFKVMTDAEVIADVKSLQTGVDNEPRFDFHQWLQTGRSGHMARMADEVTYKRISWVYACVNAVAKNMASTPMKFFNDANMSLITNKDAPINVLFNPPNAPEIESLGQLILRTYVNTGLQGLAYWVFERGESNNFERIHLYKKGQLRPITTAGPNIHDQNQDFAQLLGWELRNRSGQRLAIFTPNQVLAIRYYDPSHKYSGLAPVTAARLAIEQEFNQSAWNAAFFKQGLRNPIALKYKNVLSKDQRDEMRKQLVSYYAGVENGQSGMILEGNVEVQDLGLTTKDIDFVEGKNMTREEIAASYGVPPAVIGIFRFANYANTREQRKILWEQTLIPLQDALIDMLQAIVLDVEFSGVIAKFDRSMIDVLKPDPIRAARAAETYQEMGYTKPQIAVILDMPQLNVGDEEQEPIEEEEEEEAPTVDAGFGIKIADNGKATINPTEEWMDEYGRLQQRIMSSNEGKWERLVRTLIDSMGNDLDRQVRRSRRDVRLDTNEWTERFTSTLLGMNDQTWTLGARTVIDELLAAREGRPLLALRRLENYVGKVTDIRDSMTPEQFAEFERSIAFYSGAIRDVGADVVNAVNARASEILIRGGTVQDVRSGIVDVIGKEQSARALRIARTLSNGAFNNARIAVMQQNGVTTHRWINAGDDLVRQDHVSEGGNVTVLGQPFPVTGLRWPHDPAGPAQQVINCRCTTVPVAFRLPGERLPSAPSPADQVGGGRGSTFDTLSAGILRQVRGGPSTAQSTTAAEVGSDIISAGKVLLLSPEWSGIRQAVRGTELDIPSRIFKNSGWRINGVPARQEFGRWVQSALNPQIRADLPAITLAASDDAIQATYAVRAKRATLPRATADTLQRTFEALARGQQIDILPAAVVAALRDVGHIYGHHIQEQVPRLRQRARALYDERISREAPVTELLATGAIIETQSGRFFDPYQGRVYPGARGGEEIIPMFYERVALMPWTTELGQVFTTNAAQEQFRDIIAALIGHSAFGDSDGLRFIIEELFGA